MQNKTEFLRFGKSENFFYKNRARFLILYVSIIAVLAISVFYGITQYINIKEKHDSEIKCEYVKNICDTTLEHIEFKLYQLATNSDVEAYLANTQSTNYLALVKKPATTAVKSISIGEKYLSSVYLYNTFTDTVLFGDNAYDLRDDTDMFYDTGWYDKFASMGHNESAYIERQKISGDYYLTFIRKIDKRAFKGGIIINIDIDSLMEIAQGDYLYAVTSKGNIPLYNNNDDFSFFNSHNFSKEESVIKKLDGVNYSLTMLKSDFTGWNYYLANEIPNYTQKQLFIFLLIFIGGCLFVALGFSIASYFAYLSYKPIVNIATLLKNPNDSTSKEYLENDANTKFIAERIMYVVNSNKNLMSKLNESTELFNSAQITALQTQINPHFIYNTLTLFYLTAQDTLGKNHQLSTGLIALSKIMRYCLASDNSIVTLKEEVDSANEYLKIMKGRYANRFEIYWRIEEGCENKKILKMSLQPILENIFKYAFKKEKKEGVIFIKASLSENTIIISIKDNGLGMTSEKLEEVKEKLKKGTYNLSRHIGLCNVDKRIKIIYGEAYGITIDSMPNMGTEVILTFPDNFDESDEKKASE